MAARRATSVLPYPTSPQTSRSMGARGSGVPPCPSERPFVMSAITSSMALAWSGVSSYGNSASNSRKISSGAAKAKPWWAARAA